MPSPDFEEPKLPDIKSFALSLPVFIPFPSTDPPGASVLGVAKLASIFKTYLESKSLLKEAGRRTPRFSVNTIARERTH